MRRTLLPLILPMTPLVGAVAQPPGEPVDIRVPMRAVTQGSHAHWFGYYDKHQFDPAGRYLLGMETTFEGRAPEAGEAVRLGYVDLENDDAWTPFGESRAWSWQQGCMLQWLPGSDTEVIYNDFRDGLFVSVIRDVFSGAERVIKHPVYAMSPDGKTAVSLNFARLDETRPGYGYAGVRDRYRDDPAPANDGIYRIDLESGAARLIISYQDVIKIAPQETMTGKHWFNHLLFSPTGERFIFLHRWRPAGNETGPWATRMFTASPDTDTIHLLADHGMVSHFIWRDPEHILAWSREPETGARFHLYGDLTRNVRVIGEGVLTRDGHCTYSPDGEWILTDTYPDADRMQTLMLYRPRDGKLVTLGRFYMPRVSESQLRCDLHPRWDRSGTRICIDSMHTGQRQMYVLDVSEVFE